MIDGPWYTLKSSVIWSENMSKKVTNYKRQHFPKMIYGHACGILDVEQYQEGANSHTLQSYSIGMY